MKLLEYVGPYQHFVRFEFSVKKTCPRHWTTLKGPLSREIGIGFVFSCVVFCKENEDEFEGIYGKLNLCVLKK